MTWRRTTRNRLITGLSPAAGAPPWRRYRIDAHKLYLLGGFARMPFVGNVHSEGWRKHLIGRIKSTAYSIDDNGTRYDFDYGWTPWDFFEPALWMGAGSAADYGALGSNGQTYILQTSDFCYPWRVDWRTRSRPSSGGAWTDGADQSLVILPNSTYTVNFTAGADEELQFRDGIICVPT